MAKKISRRSEKISGRVGVAGLEHNVDRIRDILIGDSLVDVETRFEMFQNTIADLTARLDAKTKDISDETKSQIMGMQASLEEAVRDLTGQVRDAVRAQEKLENNLTKLLQKSLKDTVVALRQETSADIAQMTAAVEELKALVNDQYDELLERKIDRQELTRIFMDFINASATGR
ncbi:MAG: hypothetical protein ABIH86_03470 [Planctomycetota bacterium]